MPWGDEPWLDGTLKPWPPEADDESREDVIRMRLETGRTTMNQENRERQWPAMPRGDGPWMPGTLEQPSMIRQVHREGLEAQDAAIEQGQDADHRDGRRVAIEPEGAARRPPPQAKRDVA